MGTLGTYVSDEQLLRESSSPGGSPMLRSIQRLTSEAGDKLAKTASRAASVAQQQLIKALSGVPGMGSAFGTALSRGGSYSYVSGEDMEAEGVDGAKREVLERQEGVSSRQQQGREAEMSPMHSPQEHIFPQQQYQSSRLGSKTAASESRAAGVRRKAWPSADGAADVEREQQQQFGLSTRAAPGLIDSQVHAEVSTLTQGGSMDQLTLGISISKAHCSSTSVGLQQQQQQQGEPRDGQQQPAGQLSGSTQALAESGPRSHLVPALTASPDLRAASAPAAASLASDTSAEVRLALCESSTRDLLVQDHGGAFASRNLQAEQSSGRSSPVTIGKPNLSILQLPPSGAALATSIHMHSDSLGIHHLQQPQPHGQWQGLPPGVPAEAHGWLSGKPPGLAGLKVPPRQAAAATAAGDTLDLGLPAMPQLRLPARQLAPPAGTAAAQPGGIPGLPQLRLPTRQSAAPSVSAGPLEYVPMAAPMAGTADLSLPSMPQLRVRTIGEKPVEVVGMVPFQLYSQTPQEAGEQLQQQGHLSRGPLLDAKSAAAAKAPRNSEAGIAHRRRVRKAAGGPGGTSGFVGTPDYGNR